MAAFPEYFEILNKKQLDFICLCYSPPQNSSFIHLLPLLPESRTSERLCQIRDVSDDILCISKDNVSLNAKFTTGLHKILHKCQ